MPVPPPPIPPLPPEEPPLPEEEEEQLSSGDESEYESDDEEKERYAFYSHLQGVGLLLKWWLYFSSFWFSRWSCLQCIDVASSREYVEIFPDA